MNGIPKVPCLSFASACEVGQPVYVVGFPETDFLGYEPKLTRGIVNSVSGYKDRKDLLQIDASLTFGNSGGPVVDEYGDILGVATLISTLVGGNFKGTSNYGHYDTRAKDDARRKWEALRDEAERQDRKAREVEEENERRMAEHKDKLDEQARQREKSLRVDDDEVASELKNWLIQIERSRLRG